MIGNGKLSHRYPLQVTEIMIFGGATNIAMLFALILAFFTTTALGGLTWSDCTTGEDLFQLTSLTFSPSTPVRNELINATIKGYLKEPVGEDSLTQVSVKWGYIPIPVPAQNTCALMSSIGQADKVSIFYFLKWQLFSALLKQAMWSLMVGLRFQAFPTAYMMCQLCCAMVRAALPCAWKSNFRFIRRVKLFWINFL